MAVLVTVVCGGLVVELEGTVGSGTRVVLSVVGVASPSSEPEGWALPSILNGNEYWKTSGSESSWILSP